MTAAVPGDRRLRWLFVIPSLGGGGAERVLVQIAGELANIGDEVAVITYEKSSRDVHKLPSRIRRIETDLEALNPGIRANLKRYAALQAAIESASPDLIVSFLTHTNVLSVIAARRLRVPVIISDRVDPRRQAETRVWRLLRRLTYPWADALVVQTQSVAEWARNMRWNRRVLVVPNPVSQRLGDRSPELPELPSRFVLGMGRLVPQKGFDLLLEAFRYIRDPEVHLVIAGEGPERDRLLAQARSLGVTSRVHLTGHVRDALAIMQRASVFALSSRFEGFPNVLLEAMSTGCAVVAFDCQSGPGEMIKHGEDGLLVPAESVSDLSAAIETLCSDEQMRLRVGHAASLSVRRFFLPTICRRWRDLGFDVAGRAAANS